MTTIQKRAAQLTAGDIFETHGGRAVVLHMVDLGTHLDMYSALLGRPPLPVCEPPAQVAFDAMYTVQVGDLTPVQEHADNLLASLKWAVGFIETYARDHIGPATPEMNKARQVIDAVEPPQPPTMDEVLAALALAAKWVNLNVDRLDEDDRKQCDAAERNTTEVLNRARRAGMIK